MTRYPAYLRVASVLDVLVRRDVLAILCGGIGLVVLYLSVAIGVRCLLDYWFHFDWSARLVLLACDVLIVGWIIWRRIWQPMRYRLTRYRAALRLQRFAPELGSQLISSLQLAPEADAGRAPASLVERLLKKAVVALDEVAWKHAVALKSSMIALSVAVVSLLALVGWAMTQPQVSNILLGRFFLSTQSPIYKTRLEVVSGDMALPQGAAAELAVLVAGEIPVEVSFVLEDEAGGRETYAVEALADDAGQFTLVVDNVQAGFSYRVEGGDARSAEYRVEVLEPPVLEELQLRVSPPAYTGISPYTTSANVLQVVEGGRVSLTGQAGGKLEAAVLRLMAKGEGEAEPETSVFELKVEDVGLSAELESLGTELTHLAVALTGENGAQSVDDTHYPIRWVLDLPPEILLDAAPDGSESIAEGQPIPLRGAVLEDYGLSSLTLYWQVLRQGQANPAPTQSQAIAFSGDDNRFAVSLVARGGGDPQWLSLNAEAGTSVTWWLEAEDNCNLPRGAQRSQTEPQTFQVVTAEEKIAELMGRIREEISVLENVGEKQYDAKTSLETYLQTSPNP